MLAQFAKPSIARRMAELDNPLLQDTGQLGPEPWLARWLLFPTISKSFAEHVLVWLSGHISCSIPYTCYRRCWII